MPRQPEVRPYVSSFVAVGSRVFFDMLAMAPEEGLRTMTGIAQAVTV